MTQSAIHAACKGLNVAVLASDRMADVLRGKVARYNIVSGTCIPFFEPADDDKSGMP